MILLPKEFVKTRELYSKFLFFVRTVPAELQEVDNLMLNEETGKDWRKDLRKIFKNEYNSFLDKEIYFEGTSLSIYISFYNSRLSSFLKTKYDLLEIDFILKEYNGLKEYKLFKFCPKNIDKQIRISIRRQLEFLEQRATSLGYKIEKKKGKSGYFFDALKLQLLKEDILDFSDTRANEKIIYLEKLGVLDFLRSKNSVGLSNNKLSELLSAITGEKSATIQSYINPINNPSTSQKNNPLLNEEKVKIIDSKLKDLGFLEL